MHIQSIRWAERTSIVLIIGVLGYTGWYLKQPEERMTIVPTVKDDVIDDASPKPDLATLTSLGEPVTGRDLFSLKLPASAVQPAIDPVRSGVLPDHLKVVGILKGEPPQVVIEDMNAHKTFFIQPGEEQYGFTIERFEKGRVLLKYQSQTYTIPTY